MKVVAVLLLTLAAVAYGRPQKRLFILDIENTFTTLKEQLDAVIDNARDQFDQLAGCDINFDDAVASLIKQIDAGYTEERCINVCTADASSILGPDAPFAICAPTCTAALAKLEELAATG